jgi:hypothetical protein
MNKKPEIAVVVLSMGDPHDLRETLASLLRQEYLPARICVQFVCATVISSAEVGGLASSPSTVLQIDDVPYASAAAALGRGLARAGGDINGVLFAGDALYPTALRRVAELIDPQGGRSVVFGDSVYAGEGLLTDSVPFPAAYSGQFPLLAIWKRGVNTVPRPSVFWHRDAWSGPFAFGEGAPNVVHYELLCGLGARHVFAWIPELWSATRCNPNQGQEWGDEAQCLEAFIQASRRHWGPWYSPLRWRCELSSYIHGRQSHDRACHHARRAEECLRRQQPWAAIWPALVSLRYSPTLGWRRLWKPCITRRARRLLGGRKLAFILGRR